VSKQKDGAGENPPRWLGRYKDLKLSKPISRTCGVGQAKNKSNIKAA